MNRIRIIAGAAICAALLSYAGTPAAAQTPTVAAPVTTTATAIKLYAPLPAGMTAEKILDRAIAASGGKAVLAGVKTVYNKGTISLGAQNIKGQTETYIKLPNKIYTLQNIENVGKFESGFDGATGWSKDPINGLRVLKGKELAPFKQQVNDSANKGDWRSVYKKAEALGVRKVDGKDAYAVRLTPIASGKPIVQYFDPQTGLLVRMDMISETPQGTIPMEMYLSDYRTINGQKIPFRLRQKNPAVEASITLTEVKFNEPIPDSKFAKP